MLVRVDETRHHGHPARVDHLGALRDGDVLARPDLHDPIGLDDHGLIQARLGARAVDQKPADDGNRLRRSKRGELRPLRQQWQDADRTERGGADTEQQKSRARYGQSS